MNKRKIIISLSSLFVISLFAFSFNWFPYGYVGTTRKFQPPLGCVCHHDAATASVNVQIIGPDSIPAGTTVFYRVKISGGPAIVGGFNLANYRDGGSDTLTLSAVPNDTMVRKQEGELTHTHPKLFSNDTVSWVIRYTASNVTGIDTLYATGNSTNNNNEADTLDQWNWSLNKNIRVYNPIGIINISTVAKEFSISQNYPNPFNPVTTIRFAIPSNDKSQTSNVKLVVFDILGRKVATLVNQQLKPGTYEVKWNGSNYSSGIYYYRIESENFVDLKKMIMVK